MKKLHVLITLALCTVLAFGAIHAQPNDLTFVRADSAGIFSSRYIHWDKAEYRWTVSGSGGIGSGVEVDARFALKNVSIPASYPKMPLSDDSRALVRAICSVSPIACQSYFATNAVEGTKKMESMLLSKAQDMLRYRFIPDNDGTIPQTSYQSTVKGANVKGQFLYIDRFDVTSDNPYYGDNTTLSTTGSVISTTFSVLSERKSPEILLLDETAKIILNDRAFDKVFRSDTVDFGTLSTNGVSLGFTRTLLNRGIDPLTVKEIRLSGSLADFSVSRKDAQPLTSAKIFQRFADSLQLTLNFKPTTAGAKSAQIRIICDDPTQNDDGTEKYFLFVLKGTGVEAAIEVEEEIDFGALRVGNRKDTIVYIRSVGDVPASISKFDGVNLPFLISSAVPPFGAVLPITGLTKNSRDSIRLSFTPTQWGDFSDTLLLSGDNNIATYRVVLKGRGLQSSAKIVANPFKPESDTLFFGTTFINVPIDSVITVVNTGNIPLKIRSKVFPDFLVINTPNSSSTDDRAEFQDNFLPGIPIITSATIPVRFLSNGLFSAGCKEAWMILQIFEADPLQNPNTVLLDTVLMRGCKTEISHGGSINFDSVYVGVKKTIPWSVINNSDSTIGITGQNLKQQTPGAEMKDSPAPSLIAKRGGTMTLNFDYLPINRGIDSARFALGYSYPKPDGSTYNDSIRIGLRGIGVEQELTLVSAFNVLPPNAPMKILRGASGDTVDIGQVSLCDTVFCAMVFENKGNLPFALRSQDTFVPADDYSFVVLKRFIQPTALFPTKFDTVRVRFAPTSTAMHRLKWTLPGNIKQRIPTAPDSVQNIDFYIQGSGVRPLISANRDSIFFGSMIVTQKCTQFDSLISIRISNPGNAPLEISSLDIQNKMVFSLVSTAGITIQPNQSAQISVRFLPIGVADFNGSLLLVSNAGCPADTLRIPLFGRGIAPPAVTVSLPQETRAKTGRKIAIPILVERNNQTKTMSAATFARLSLTFEKTLLEFVSAITLQSASEGKIISRAVENPQGTLSLEINGSSPFLERDTLVTLIFNTYLGDKSYTELTIDTLLFGNSKCDELLTIQKKTGIFALDSICALPLKAVTSPAGFFSLSHTSPNPVTSSGKIQYGVAFPVHVSIEVFNAFGTKVRTLAEGWHPAGIYEVEIPANELEAGVYFYEMRAGIFHEVQRFVILR